MKNYMIRYIDYEFFYYNVQVKFLIDSGFFEENYQIFLFSKVKRVVFDWCFFFWWIGKVLN